MPEETSIIRLSFCLRRGREVAIDDFQRYWLEVHGPLVRSFAEVLGIRRYVQGHAARGELGDELARQRGTKPAFDGIADAWFDSVDAMLGCAATAAGRQALKRLLEDEKRFIDLERSVVTLVQENVLVEPASPGPRDEQRTSVAEHIHQVGVDHG